MKINRRSFFKYCGISLLVLPFLKVPKIEEESLHWPEKVNWSKGKAPALDQAGYFQERMMFSGNRFGKSNSIIQLKESIARIRERMALEAFRVYAR